MKTLTKIFFIAIISACSSVAFCQERVDVNALVDRGVALNDSGKYDSAIAKYQDALKIDPASLRAQYELSYTLAASGKPKEAIPYLEKVAATNSYPAAFSLLGDIYDDEGDFAKSVAYYKQGLIAFPKFQKLWFNLGISYLRQKMYPEAEQAGIQAIQLDPKHASSQRLYALATHYQNKDVPAIMAFCNFLILEPQTKRSAEAYQYIQQIFQSKVRIDSTVNGVTKGMTIFVRDNKGGDSDEFGLETALSISAASPELDKNKDKTPVTMLEDELSTIFKIAGELSAKRKGKDFFWNYYVDYFYHLAQSDNMPAFTRLISLSGYREENLKWFKDNDDKLSALDRWVADNKRAF